MTAPRRYLPLATLLIAIVALYLYNLDGVGMLGPDEPRYAAIGRAMARTGDWITPRLWGAPWFEKPPLLYWMTALGTELGLNSELAARLPVTALSLAFLGVYGWTLRREFGSEAAVVSTALLSTSAGWLAFSGIGVTDIPLAVFFSISILAALPMAEPARLFSTREQNARLAATGFCLGAAVLAKGLVPLALGIPVAWFLRAHWKRWWITASAAMLVAGPWYVAVYLRNGNIFIQEFFIKHHLERLYSGVIQHVQPWHYYLPVLLAALFPWTPLLGLTGMLKGSWNQRRRLLLATVVWGFVFFSASLNKLPGYLLPLLPSLFALLGSVFQHRRVSQLSRAWLMTAACFIAIIPVLGTVLPQLLSGDGSSGFPVHSITRTTLFYLLLPVAVAILARRSWAGILLVLCVVTGGILLKAKAYPLMDRNFSVRRFWREIAPDGGHYCDAGLHRNWQYGLSYYLEKELPVCGERRGVIALKQTGNERPEQKIIP